MKTPFVILVHSGCGRAHFDLMIQSGPALATWQCAVSPIDIGPSGQIPATKLADHRLAYLTYEGPVSRNRGQVQRLDSGQCEIVSQDDGRWLVQFKGQLINGSFLLQCLDNERWSVRQIPA